MLCTVFGGCESLLGEWTTRTPNHGKSLAKVDREKPLAVDDAVIDHEFRVDINGEAPASLWVWVIDPSNEKFVDLETKEDDPEYIRGLFAIDGDAPRQTRTPVATVLILHSFYDTINKRWYLMWARMLAEEGYRVVLVDQRGHGRSTGDWATYGVREMGDMQRVLDVLEEKNLLVEPLGLWGLSFGGSTAVRLAEADDRVKAMLLISTFTSMRDVVPTFGREIGFSFLSDEQFTEVIDHAGRHGNFDPDEADVIERLARIDTPTLIIHGEDDRLVPIQQAVRLYHAADRENVELIRVRNANHTTLSDTVVWPIYRPMLDWFDRYLAPAEQKAAAGDEGPVTFETR
ncbi:MAG: alpha/beta fold hydrolase [Planctomycetota bacterium]